MDADAVQKEAYAAALVHVAQLLQRSDQLEKLDSLRKRADRKKVATFKSFPAAFHSMILVVDELIFSRLGCIHRSYILYFIVPRSLGIAICAVSKLHVSL